VKSNPAKILAAALTFVASLNAQPGEQYPVKRGAPERHGRAWVERSEFTAPAREGGRLVVRADAGSVVVKAGAGDKVECQAVLRAFTSSEARARRDFSAYEVSARALEGGGVYIAGRGPGEERTSLGAEFDITVPARYNLDIETQGGDINLESSLQGEVRAITAGGDVHTADVSGRVRVETAGGDILLGNVGQRVEARTAGGSIRVDNVAGEATLETSGGEITAGHVAGAVHAETAGGDVVIDGAGGPVVAQTAGGQIRIGPSTGEVHAQTSGGSIWCRGARGRVDVDTAGGSINLFDIQGAIRASTAAGRILAQIQGGRKTFGASELENSMGDVQVFIPADLALTVDAAIESGAGHEILSDFPLVVQGSGEGSCDREIVGRGKLNGGGEVLRIRTVNGDIEIRKLDSQALERMRERQNAEWQYSQERRAEKENRREHKHRETEPQEDNDDAE